MSRRAALRLASDVVAQPLRSRISASAGPVWSSTRFPAVRAASTKAPGKADPVTNASPAAPTQPVASSSKTQLGKEPAAKGKDLVVPPLSRPPGVAHPPSTVKKTWSDKKAELLDAERHKAKRKALMKEASQGYFHDYNRARSANGGKLWTAPSVLIREDMARYFPDLIGKSLPTGSEAHTTDLMQGKISVVTILNTRLSEEHAQSFVQQTLADWEGDQAFSYLQINHQSNVLKSMLLSFFLSSLKRSIPEHRWATYLVASGEWDQLDIMRPLGMENSILGYVYLVDQNLKVRWAGCGPATPKEAEDLRTATAVLMRRLTGKDAPPGAASPATEDA